MTPMLKISQEWRIAHLVDLGSEPSFREARLALSWLSLDERRFRVGTQRFI